MGWKLWLGTCLVIIAYGVAAPKATFPPRSILDDETLLLREPSSDRHRRSLNAVGNDNEFRGGYTVIEKPAQKIQDSQEDNKQIVGAFARLPPPPLPNTSRRRDDPRGLERNVVNSNSAGDSLFTFRDGDGNFLSNQRNMFINQKRGSKNHGHNLSKMPHLNSRRPNSHPVNSNSYGNRFDIEPEVSRNPVISNSIFVNPDPREVLGIPSYEGESPIIIRRDNGASSNTPVMVHLGGPRRGGSPPQTDGTGFDPNKRDFDFPNRGVGSVGAGFGSVDSQVGSNAAGIGTPHRGLGPNDVNIGSNNVGFRTPQRGFGTNNVGLDSNNVGFRTPQRGFGTNNVGVDSNNIGPGIPHRGFGTNNVGLDSNNVGPGTPHRGFGMNNVGFGTSHKGIGSNDRNFETPQRGTGSHDVGFGTPPRGFGSSNGFYGTPHRGFDSNNVGLRTPKRGFDSKVVGFGPPQRGLGSKNKGFRDPQRGFDINDVEFGTPQKGFDFNNEGFGTPQRGFGSNNVGFGTPHRGFGSSDRDFNFNRRVDSSERKFGSNNRGFGSSEGGFGSSERGLFDKFGPVITTIHGSHERPNFVAPHDSHTPQFIHVPQVPSVPQIPHDTNVPHVNRRIDTPSILRPGSYPSTFYPTQTVIPVSRPSITRTPLVIQVPPGSAGSRSGNGIPFAGNTYAPDIAVLYDFGSGVYNPTKINSKFDFNSGAISQFGNHGSHQAHQTNQANQAQQIHQAHSDHQPHQTHQANRGHQTNQAHQAYREPQPHQAYREPQPHQTHQAHREHKANQAQQAYQTHQTHQAHREHQSQQKHQAPREHQSHQTHYPHQMHQTHLEPQPDFHVNDVNYQGNFRPSNKNFPGNPGNYKINGKRHQGNFRINDKKFHISYPNVKVSDKYFQGNQANFQVNGKRSQIDRGNFEGNQRKRQGNLATSHNNEQRNQRNFLNSNQIQDPTFSNYHFDPQDHNSISSKSKRTSSNSQQFKISRHTPISDNLWFAKPTKRPYAYEYSVNSPTTGDHKMAYERRGPDGSVTGGYSFLQPDGKIRYVTYTADGIRGFRTNVKYL